MKNVGFNAISFKICAKNINISVTRIHRNKILDSKDIFKNTSICFANLKNNTH